jgi:predicted flap endonuclease-1-like 5' DNA nuclease
MTFHAIVKRKRKTRKGRGFSREELRDVGLSFTEALKLGIPIDTKRSTKHQENVKTLEAYAEEFELKPTLKGEKGKILELTEVEGIGPKTAEKLRGVGVETANELASSNPEKIMEATGSSKKRASALIEDARSLLKED